MGKSHNLFPMFVGTGIGNKEKKCEEYLVLDEENRNEDENQEPRK